MNYRNENGSFDVKELWYIDWWTLETYTEYKKNWKQIKVPG